MGKIAYLKKKGSSDRIFPIPGQVYALGSQISWQIYIFSYTNELKCIVPLGYLSMVGFFPLLNIGMDIL